MSKQYDIAPSILSADFSRLGEEVQAVESAGASRIHIDVMDGHFVPPITMGTPIVRACRKVTALPLDVHLMIEQPEKHITTFANAGASTLIVHIESTKDIKAVLKQIRQHKILAGITLKPSTPIQHIFTFLDQIDFVLIMTVHPGASGQKLLPEQLEKLTLTRKELIRRGLSKTPIHVDGGVNDTLLPALTAADILISGDFIFKHTNYRKAISVLQNPSGNRLNG